MITTEPTMTNLFLQLGLDASEQGIAQFIKGHQLAAGVPVADAAWAVIVDQLSESLHEDAVRRSTGL